MDIKNDGARYAFITRWHDPMTDIVWKYQFMYHTSDRSIEMVCPLPRAISILLIRVIHGITFCTLISGLQKTSERETDEEFDIKNQKTFLKRVAYPAISLEQLYIGSTILVYTRQLLIEDYGDDFTRKHLRGLQETTCAMIKPDAICHAGKILECITSNGLLVKHMRMCQLSRKQAEEFYKVHQGKPFYEALILLVSSGPVIALELVGPTSTEVARIKAPSSIRAQYGTDTTKNACHGSDSHENARIETLFFFKCWNMGMCARFKSCSLCIIKPHVVMSGCGGAILDRIQQKFDVTALELAHFNRHAAADFLQVYQGICPDFFSMTHELASGDFIILEVCDKTNPCSNPVNKFREFCGPADSCIARALRSQSLRAEFGINKVKNAVHCTDIQEDGELEVGYMFTHQWQGK